MTVTDAAAREALLDDLTAAGYLSGAWRPHFAAVDRALFIPAEVWVADGTEDDYRVVARAGDPDGWMRLVWSDTALVTQLDDGRCGGPGVPTSSSSEPGIMAVMLGHFDVSGGRVLEAGTGTGYNAALLCERFGDDQVVSVETDAGVAARASAALASAGYRPHLVVGDASAGHTSHAPYSGVIATYSVTRVPWAWVEQTRPGGVLVVPFDTGLRRQFLTRFTVTDQGTAVGQVVGGAAFMRDRTQRVTSDDVPEVGGWDSETDLDPRDVLHDYDANAWVTAHIDGVLTWTGANDVMGEYVGLEDPGSGSWAHISTAGAPRRVRQGGPRRLWGEVADAYGAWREAGFPPATAARITVSREAQTVAY